MQDRPQLTLKTASVSINVRSLFISFCFLFADKEGDPFIAILPLGRRMFSILFYLLLVCGLASFLFLSFFVCRFVNDTRKKAS